MPTFLITRIVQGIVSLLGITLLVFVFLRVGGGDPAVMLLPPEASQQEVGAMREKLGLDRPLIVQYGSFLAAAAQGDFGQSFRQREPALDVVLRHLPATAQLALTSLVIATLISFPLGIVAAVRRGSITDYVATVVAVLGQSIPAFWLGILLILLFAVTLSWLPVSGRGGLAHLVLPAATLGWYMNALMTRLVRSSMLETLSKDYIRTAHSKGLPRSRIVNKHGLRNALVPIITVWALQAGTLLTGTVVVETVFAWPGLGRASIDAVLGRDYPVVLASVFVFTIIFIVINFLVDLAYFWIDPRIRSAK